MVDLDRGSGDPDPGKMCLDAYRETVERLHDETVDELGRPPMAPETVAMLAVIVAALPVVAALHPGNAVELAVWQVGVLLAAVWAGAFWLQRGRYDRFQAAWSRKVADHGAGPLVIPVRDFRYRSPGQTTGA